MSIRIYRFLGKSGSGKTTLIDTLLKRLAHLRIAVIKHTRHPLDQPENTKDTACHLAAGATISAGVSPGRSEVFFQGVDLEIETLIPFLAGRVDLIFLEGARHFDVPTILLGDFPDDSIATDILVTLPMRPNLSPDQIDTLTAVLTRI
ncbi:MAG TPA: molybdopterin-guanine dinucleotide biosynthesis protein MobB [Candidatus Ozemobacteraceae bacterium]|nr:molybdopterin-guanine dinucleotide biosynthesis protein MobB [Candidatus Ozemobacteraceae bacterium]